MQCLLKKNHLTPNDVDMTLLDGVLVYVVRWVLGGEHGGLGRLPAEPSRFLAVALAHGVETGTAADADFLTVFAALLLSVDGTKTSNGARSEGGVGSRRLGRPRSTEPPEIKHSIIKLIKKSMMSTGR